VWQRFSCWREGKVLLVKIPIPVVRVSGKFMWPGNIYLFHEMLTIRDDVATKVQSHEFAIFVLGFHVHSGAQRAVHSRQIQLLLESWSLLFLFKAVLLKMQPEGKIRLIDFNDCSFGVYDFTMNFWLFWFFGFPADMQAVHCTLSADDGTVKNITSSEQFSFFSFIADRLTPCRLFYWCRKIENRDSLLDKPFA
jgi:hypothetical protein